LSAKHKKVRRNARTVWNRRLHALLPHEVLRDMAYNRYGVESMSELTTTQLRELYRQAGGAVKVRRPTDPATERQLYKIAKLRPGALLGNDKSWRLWLARKFKVWNPDALTLKQASNVIEALKSMNERTGNHGGE